MSAPKSRWWIAALAILVAGGGVAAVAMGNLGEALIYYWTPSELLANGEKAYGPTIRLGGVVKKGSIQWDPERTELRFEIAESVEPNAASVRVVAADVPPQMFREAIGVVVEGTYSPDGKFTSHRLMVNHSNEYRPPANHPGGKDKSWQETVAAPSAEASR